MRHVKAFIPAFWLLLPLVVLLVPPLFNARSFYHEDLATYFYGLRGQLGAVLQHLSEGLSLVDSLPLWNPNSGMGLPLWADIQLAPLYPINLLFYGLSTPRAFAWYYFIHFTLLTLAGYQLFRYMGRSAPSAVFGTWVLVWSGWYWSHLHHATFIAAGAWLPMFLHGTLQTVREKRYGVPRVWCAMTMMSLAGGSPQLLYYSLLVVGSYCVTQGWDGQGWREGVRLRGAWLLSVLLGIGVGAAQWLPFLYASQEKYQEPLSAFEYSSSFALPVTALVRVLLPQYFGNDFFSEAASGGYTGPSTYWESWCYLGIITLPLVLLGFKRKGDTGFFTLLFCFSSLASLGKLGGIHFLLMLLPYYDRMRAPSRWILLTTLAGAVLASGVLDELHRLLLTKRDALNSEANIQWEQKIRKYSKYFLVLSFEVLVVALLLGVASDSPMSYLARQGFMLTTFQVALAYILLRTCVSRLRASPSEALQPDAQGTWRQRDLISGLIVQHFPWLVMMLLCLDLMPILLRYNLTIPDHEILQRPALIEVLTPKLEQGRMLSDREAPVYLLNAGLEYGVATVRSYNPLNSARVQRFMEAADESGPREGGISLLVEHPDAPMYRLLSARWHVRGTPAPKLEQARIWADPSKQQYLYEDVLAYPRVWWTRDVFRASSDAALWAQARAIARMGTRQAVIDARYELPEFTAAKPDEAYDVVSEVKREHPARWRLKGQASGPLLVIMAEGYASGWHAEINGKPGQLLPAFETLQALVIPQAGAFEAVIKYEPPGLRIGMICSLLSILGYALLRRFR
ncbi:MAG: hypothetical protein ACKO6N_19270 [Myxococcota bacterium]